MYNALICLALLSDEWVRKQLALHILRLLRKGMEGEMPKPYVAKFTKERLRENPAIAFEAIDITMTSRQKWNMLDEFALENKFWEETSPTRAAEAAYCEYHVIVGREKGTAILFEGLVKNTADLLAPPCNTSQKWMEIAFNGVRTLCSSQANRVIEER